MSRLAFLAAGRRTSFFAYQTQFMCDSANFRSHQDYENYLQCGIEAFIWIDRAEEDYRHAVANGRAPFGTDVDKTLMELYESWLQSYAFGLAWVEECRALSDFGKFRECHEEIRDLHEQCAWRQLSRTTRQG